LSLYCYSLTTGDCNCTILTTELSFGRKLET
jgi:hypothetical protein